VTLLSSLQGFLAARVGGGRASAITPVQWVIALLIAGLAGSYRLPSWMTVLLGVLLAWMVGFFCVIYCVWMKISPDALRSESYLLGRQAIDRGFLGDDASGPRRRRGGGPPAAQENP
jgi:hypothetical protein